MIQPTPNQIREFVIAGHGNLPKVQALLAETQRFCIWPKRGARLTTKRPFRRRRTWARGAVAGASMALAHANPDLNWKNWQEKTAREIAEATGHAEIVVLLK